VAVSRLLVVVLGGYLIASGGMDRPSGRKGQRAETTYALRLLPAPDRDESFGHQVDREEQGV
jgi:hypothetical protein